MNEAEDGVASKQLIKLGEIAKKYNLSWPGFFKFLFFPAAILVVFFNVFVFWLPDFNWSKTLSLVWLYWFQSVMIGTLHFFKLLFYKFKAPVNPKPNEITGRVFISIFFVLHFGFFHFIYTFFLGTKGVDWNFIQQGILYLAIGTALNTVMNYKNENSGENTQALFMMKPYVRIVPIHMAIILGAMFGGTGVFIVLIALKTVMELFIEYLTFKKVNLSEETEQLNSIQ